MSFRGRLRLFFTIIVIVPMVAVALVLFTLTAQSETGKADAGIAAGLRTALSHYAALSDRAGRELRIVARDPQLRTFLLRGRTLAAQRRMRELVASEPPVKQIELFDPAGNVAARAGARDAIAPKMAPLEAPGGRAIGTLAVSVTTARGFVREVQQLTGLEVSAFRGGARLATTLPTADGAPELGPPDKSRDFRVNGDDYRGRTDRVRQPVGASVEIAVFRKSADVQSTIAENRLVIALILLAFLGLALATSVFVVRALQAQIGEFLQAAQRLARGDFTHAVPTSGSDEFALLGREFNSMSQQLEAKIDEVERKRGELEETIRRVGAAFASGLDRQGVVELAVETAVDACEAESGRALPLDANLFREVRTGAAGSPLDVALEAAEREAFAVRPEIGAELLERGAPVEPQPGKRGPISASMDGSHALAVPMRARLGSRSAAQYVGVISIARRGEPFARQEEELLEYLAGQAVVSIENADLHETVQRQAVTDELTGLANVRELHAVLDRELERSRRFRNSLGLVMLDIDDFKQVNDLNGHQQGDEVLAAVARVLRDLSRDIDEPARYGGEEMAVVLPETDANGAAQVAERMREAIEALRVPRVGGGDPLHITASFGVASIPDSADDKDSLIAAADTALYRAKRAGKNRVERAEAVAAPS